MCFSNGQTLAIFSLSLSPLLRLSPSLFSCSSLFLYLCLCLCLCIYLCLCLCLYLCPCLYPCLRDDFLSLSLSFLITLSTSLLLAVSIHTSLTLFFISTHPFFLYRVLDRANKLKSVNEFAKYNGRC